MTVYCRINPSSFVDIPLNPTPSPVRSPLPGGLCGAGSHEKTSEKPPKHTLNFEGFAKMGQQVRFVSEVLLWHRVFA